MAASTDKVVMEQSLVKIDEVFVYRIPPMRSADGHRWVAMFLPCISCLRLAFSHLARWNTMHEQQTPVSTIATPYLSFCFLSILANRAEDWNLAKPLATCKLEVLRRDNSLCINIMADRPKPGASAGATETYLFAQSNITVDFSNPSHKMDRWWDSFLLLRIHFMSMTNWMAHVFNSQEIFFAFILFNLSTILRHPKSSPKKF